LFRTRGPAPIKLLKIVVIAVVSERTAGVVCRLQQQQRGIVDEAIDQCWRRLAWWRCALVRKAITWTPSVVKKLKFLCGHALLRVHRSGLLSATKCYVRCLPVNYLKTL